jgi:MYXO-CTERM domain-containing protein
VSAAADTVGESGLFTMLWYPSVANGESVVMPQRAAVNRSLRSQRPFVYGYEHPATTGWDGDRLVPYVSDSAGENETAFVWQTAWDSADEAAEFREAYLELLEYRGATPVEGRQDTYRVPDDRRFGDAFYVAQDGETLTIVNAPSVEELSAVRTGAAPAAETPTPTSFPTATDEHTPTLTRSPTSTAAPDASSPVPETDDGAPTTDDAPATATTSGDGPGFGPGLAALALALVAAALVGRRRD